MTESVAPAEHRLRPGELAEAAVMADLAVLAVLLARLSPFAGLTAVVGAVPFVVLGIRHRTRAIVVAFVVAVVLVFLLAGFNAATQVLVMAVFGGLIGRGMQLGWSAAPVDHRRRLRMGPRGVADRQGSCGCSPACVNSTSTHCECSGRVSPRGSTPSVSIRSCRLSILGSSR
ncbi:MAG: hypothetical protein R2710_29900 [Acidimicrobiales bacterium]